MHMPTVKRELNTNTLIQVAGFLIVVGGLIWSAAQQQAGVGELQRKYDNWIAAHENLHKERQATVTGDTARLDTRLTALETATREMENIKYRVTVLEQGSLNLTRSVEELKTAVNGQAADIRVMLEILRRMDPTIKPVQ